MNPIDAVEVGMLRGPKGQRRPADVVGNAVHVLKVLTGEAVDAMEGELTSQARRNQPMRRANREKTKTTE